jgi:ribosomal protein L11
MVLALLVAGYAPGAPPVRHAFGPVDVRGRDVVKEAPNARGEIIR